jgi:hypothetical protein
MQIVFNDEEEAAVTRYAVRHKITYGEALQRIIDAMTEGLMELARKDDDEIIETLDNNAPDSDTD